MTTTGKAGRRGSGAFIALFIAIAALLAGCGDSVREDRQLSSELLELAREGGDALLRDLTDEDWDEVYIAPERVSRRFVEQQVGAPVPMEEEFTRSGHIVVFLSGGAVRRVVYVRAPIHLDGTLGTYDTTVRLVGTPPPPHNKNPLFLKLKIVDG